MKAPSPLPQNAAQQVVEENALAAAASARDDPEVSRLKPAGKRVEIREAVKRAAR